MATTRPTRKPASPTPASPLSSSAISKGATARSAVSPRSSLRSPTGRPGARAQLINGEDSREAMAEALRRETDLKEQLSVQVQNKELSITELTSENTHLSSALNAAESRLAELYADQHRTEEETAARIEVAEKLRIQVRELEKERRDLQRRYNEQTATFEAERQAFYDNEQHLKSRIQSLTQSVAQARSQAMPTSPPASADSITEAGQEDEDHPETPAAAEVPKQDMSDPEQEPAEMTALKLELSTLSTSHASIQSTLILLQTQLVDLKRVNNSLQEENESYMILLREKTLSGQYDVMRQMGDGSTSTLSSDEDEDSNVVDNRSLRSSTRSTLDKVDEADEDQYNSDHPPHELDSALAEPEREEPPRRSVGRHSHSKSASGGPGESLAGLPLTGPGLDLAAELGRAENKDVFSGSNLPSATFDASPSKPKRGKRGAVGQPRIPSLASELAASADKTDVETLRNEVKSLKDANKALSLYASKIIDRIIAQEGFEHVLAADYDKEPDVELPEPVPEPPKSKKSRPKSFFGMGSTPAAPPPAPRSVEESDATSYSSERSWPPPELKSDPAIAAAKRAENRRSFSLDWSSFSIFGGTSSSSKPSESDRASPALRPLTLKPGATTLSNPSKSLGSARKLETFEDDEDRRERERLAATMRLMGIEKPSTPPVPLVRDASPVSSPTIPSPDTAKPALLARSSSTRSTSRWGLFRSRATDDTSSQASSNTSLKSPNPSGLTQEALEQAEAEQKLAALDAHERVLAEQLSKGGSSGFTEMAPRRKGGRKSAGGSGSGSTVWSAGMGKDGDD